MKQKDQIHRLHLSVLQVQQARPFHHRLQLARVFHRLNRFRHRPVLVRLIVHQLQSLARFLQAQVLLQVIHRLRAYRLLRVFHLHLVFLHPVRFHQAQV
jgi:hypothetical protein